MSEIFQYLQRLRDDRVAFLAFDMNDKAQATGVVLVARVVQALLGGWLGARVSGDLIHVVLTAFHNTNRSMPRLVWTETGFTTPRRRNLSHTSHIVASRQPKSPCDRGCGLRLSKALAPATDLRFNLNKVAYMLVATFKTAGCRRIFRTYHQGPVHGAKPYKRSLAAVHFRPARVRNACGSGRLRRRK